MALDVSFIIMAGQLWAAELTCIQYALGCLKSHAKNKDMETKSSIFAQKHGQASELQRKKIVQLSKWGNGCPWGTGKEDGHFLN